MSLEVDGVWKTGVWATTVWASGVWREGAPPEPPALLVNPKYIQSIARTNQTQIIKRTNNISKVR